MQTSIDDSSIFIEVSREAHASPLFSLEPFIRMPSQVPSFQWGNFVEPAGLLHAQVGPCYAFSRTTPLHLHY